jgi:uncharacterized protein YcbK (DUF882 family)
MITKDFSREEFACKCGCGADHIRTDLVIILQNIRDYFNKPVKINSGVRCVRHNKRVGGAKNSKHLTGEAADIKIVGVSPRAISMVANDLLGRRGGVKVYRTFTHIDIRKGYWRA